MTLVPARSAPVVRALVGLTLASALLAFAWHHVGAPRDGIPPADVLATAAAGVLVAYAVSWAARGARFAAFARGAGARGDAFSLALVQAHAFAWNLVLPAKAGDVAQVALLTRRGWRARDALAASVAVRVLDLLAILTFTAALGALAWRAADAGSVLVTAGLVAGALTGACALAYRVPESRLARCVDAKLPARWRARDLTVTHVTRAFARLVPAAGTTRVVTLTLVVWSAELAGAAWAGHVLGVPALVAAFAGSAALVASAVPVTPGGLGVYELVFARAAASPGAFTAALVEHGVKALAVLVVAALSAAGWALAPARADPDAGAH